MWTQGAGLAGFIKRTFIQSYTQKEKLWALWFWRRFFLCFSHCDSMGAYDPWGGAIFDPRGMVGRVYEVDNYTLLHTQSESTGPCDFGEEDFLCFSHDAPGVGPVRTPAARLEGFIKRTTKFCYIKHMKLWAWWFQRAFSSGELINHSILISQ